MTRHKAYIAIFLFYTSLLMAGGWFVFRGSQVPEEENKLTGSDPVKVVSTSSESESQKSPKEEIIITSPIATELTIFIPIL